MTRTCALRDHPAGTRIHRAQDTGPRLDLCQSRRGHLREPTCTHRVGVIKNHILPAPTAAGGTRLVATPPPPPPGKREDPGVPAPACRHFHLSRQPPTPPTQQTGHRLESAQLTSAKHLIFHEIPSQSPSHNQSPFPYVVTSPQICENDTHVPRLTTSLGL